jgi:hypothetical protein
MYYKFIAEGVTDNKEVFANLWEALAILKMEAICSYRMLVPTYHSMWSHLPGRPQYEAQIG